MESGKWKVERKSVKNKRIKAKQKIKARTVRAGSSKWKVESGKWKVERIKIKAKDKGKR